MPKRGDDEWERPKRVERQYRDAIDRLLDDFFRSPSASALGEISARLVEWSQLDQLFQQGAERAASRMVTGVAAHNMKNWKEAASASMRGAHIYRILRQEMRGPVGAEMMRQVRRNADLIKSLPAELARDTTKFIAEQQQRGLRSEAIVAQLKVKMPELRDFQVKRIARTETAKAETAITRVRSEHLALDWYEWDTSEDARVRPSHRKMDRVLVRWSDPPAPEQLIGIKSSLGHYHAGEAPYCRCGAYPLVAVNEVRWPHKVYTSGRIIVMSRPQFLELAPGYRIAA